MSHDAFTPAWWLPGAHAQTMGARFLRSRRRGGITLRRERLELPDGDFVDLDWTVGAERIVGTEGTDGEEGAERRGPLVLLLHGLEGSARSGYAIETYRQLGRRGIDSVGLNFRSCSGELNRLARLYHSGETGDLRYVLSARRERCTGRALGVIGISLGGNVLLKYLGEAGNGRLPAPDAAVAISVPFDLSTGADQMERGFGRAYRWFLVRKLKRKVRGKLELLNGRIDVERVLRARSFRECDEYATAPLHGFAGAEDYYRKSSSNRFIQSVRVPTLLLHSRDDPFLPPAALPLSAIEANPFLTLVLTDRGGHVGFFEGGPPWNPAFWMEEQSASFLAHHHQGTPAATGDVHPLEAGWVDPNPENI